MKQIIAPSYTFTPGVSGAGTVDLSGISGFNPKYLVSIINQTRGEIIYSTASSLLKYTNVTGTVVTLFKDTSAMSSGDVLQVVYEVQGSTPVSGPLTDAELRATPVPISGTVSANTGLSQPLTDAQLRASAVPVAPNVTMGSGVIDANTQRVTLATDGQVVTDIGSINTKTPALDNSKQPVIPSMTSGGNISVTTAATGTNWTAFASQALKQLTVSNQTGTNIEFRQGGAGVGFVVPAGAIFTFFGITNANQIEARRTDTSNTQVTITSRWEA